MKVQMVVTHIPTDREATHDEYAQAGDSTDSGTSRIARVLWLSRGAS